MNEYGEPNGAENGYVQMPRSIFRRNRNPRELKRHRQIQAMLDEKENTTNHLFRFKVMPTQDPDPTETRRLPRCCVTCIPESEANIQEEMKHLGLLDCLKPPTLSSYNSRFCRTFPFFSYYSKVFSSNKRAKMHALPRWTDLEKDPNLLSAFSDEFTRNPPTTTETTKQEVLKILYELQVTNVWELFYSMFMRVSAWLCQKYFAIHFESVLVHGGQLELLRDVHEKRLPVIYIPTYRSNFDKSLILWTLAHYGFQPPLFFRDHHLAKSKLLNIFGGIGSSHQVQSNRYSEKKYCLATTVYMKHLLRQGNSLMFNLESGRTRSGRSAANVYGAELIKIIYDEYESEQVEDVYFVPVSVSYELLPEAKEIVRDSGSWKQKLGHSLFSWMGTIFWGTLFPTKAMKGNVRIDFSQPTSFRELKKSLDKNVKFLRLINEENDSYSHAQNCEYLKWGSTESLNSICSLYGELAPLYPVGSPEKDKEAILIDLVTHHLVYDAGNCASVMPTHLLAFLLMKKFRNGILLDELKREMQWLVDTLQKKYKKDFGFYILDCDMESIIVRAMEMLQEDVICQWIEEKKTYRFAPSQEIGSLRRLEYYSNYILPDFILEGVIATAIFAIRATDLATLRGFDMEVTITDPDLMFHCRRVYAPLTGAFLLHPPCWATDTAIRKQISQMADYGLLSLVMSDPRRYNWEDDMSDYEYNPVGPVDGNRRREVLDQEFTFVPEVVKVITTKHVFNHLSFHRRLLMPYFEIFAFLTNSLEVLLDKKEKRMEMAELERYLLNNLMAVSSSEFYHCQELCTRYTVKQFLVACESHRYLYIGMSRDLDNMERMYYLEKEKKDLIQLRKNFMFYVTI